MNVGNYQQQTDDRPQQIFVGGCHPDLKDYELTDYFAKYGDITESRLVRDKLTKKFRGFGFVTFRSAKVADMVLSISNHVIRGKAVQLKKAISKEKTHQKLMEEKLRKLFLMNIDKSLRKDDCHRYFSKYGKILQVKIVHEKRKNGQEKNYGFVLFADKGSMLKVFRDGENHKVRGLRVDCKPTLLRDELKQIHLQKLQHPNPGSASQFGSYEQFESQSSHKKRKRKRKKRGGKGESNRGPGSRNELGYDPRDRHRGEDEYQVKHRDNRGERHHRGGHYQEDEEENNHYQSNNNNSRKRHKQSGKRSSRAREGQDSYPELAEKPYSGMRGRQKSEAENHRLREEKRQSHEKNTKSHHNFDNEQQNQPPHRTSDVSKIDSCWLGSESQADGESEAGDQSNYKKHSGDSYPTNFTTNTDHRAHSEEGEHNKINSASSRNGRHHQSEISINEEDANTRAGGFNGLVGGNLQAESDTSRSIEKQKHAVGDGHHGKNNNNQKLPKSEIFNMGGSTVLRYEGKNNTPSGRGSQSGGEVSLEGGMAGNPSRQQNRSGGFDIQVNLPDGRPSNEDLLYRQDPYQYTPQQSLPSAPHLGPSGMSVDQANMMHHGAQQLHNNNIYSLKPQMGNALPQHQQLGQQMYYGSGQAYGLQMPGNPQPPGYLRGRGEVMRTGHNNIFTAEYGQQQHYNLHQPPLNNGNNQNNINNHQGYGPKKLIPDKAHSDSFNQNGDDKPHPGFHMYRMIPYDTKSEGLNARLTGDSTNLEAYKNPSNSRSQSDVVRVHYGTGLSGFNTGENNLENTNMLRVDHASGYNPAQRHASNMTAPAGREGGAQQEEDSEEHRVSTLAQMDSGERYPSGARCSDTKELASMIEDNSKPTSDDQVGRLTGISDNERITERVMRNNTAKECRSALKPPPESSLSRRLLRLQENYHFEEYVLGFKVSAKKEDFMPKNDLPTTVSSSTQNEDGSGPEISDGSQEQETKQDQDDGFELARKRNIAFLELVGSQIAENGDGYGA